MATLPDHVLESWNRGERGGYYINPVGPHRGLINKYDLVPVGNSRYYRPRWPLRRYELEADRQAYWDERVAEDYARGLRDLNVPLDSSLTAPRL